MLVLLALAGLTDPGLALAFSPALVLVALFACGRAPW